MSADAVNIFVLGLNELNSETLSHLPDAAHHRFHPLLSADELTQAEPIDVAGLLDKAQAELETFGGSIDAIVGYWDFPTTSMGPILCRRVGLPSPPLEALVKCEHKYWSRLEQQKVTDAFPRFGLVDLHGSPHPPEGMGFPMWLKPVKSASSMLAFKVTDLSEFERAVTKIRHGIGRLGKPFDYVLSMVDLPAEIADVGGQACLAEEAASGFQATVEGYVHQGHVHVYGVVDSIHYDGNSSFLRYQYPSRLPAEVIDELAEISKRVVSQIGLDRSPFNIEYFWDPDTGAIRLLEINPRVSQSHARLFEAVDGVSNHHCMVALALGADPHMPHRQGDHNIAAKWFLRRFSDGVVRRLPPPDVIAQLERQLPGVAIALVPRPGDRLSHLACQDSYSYELANIFITARTQQDMLETYERCVQALHFEIDIDDAGSRDPPSRSAAEEIIARRGLHPHPVDLA